MIGVMEVLMLPLFDSWSGKMFPVFFVHAVVSYSKSFLSWDDPLLRC